MYITISRSSAKKLKQKVNRRDKLFKKKRFELKGKEEGRMDRQIENNKMVGLNPTVQLQKI